MPTGVYANGASRTDGKTYACNAIFSPELLMIVDNVNKPQFRGPVPVMFLIAMEDIKQGEEIFVEYSFA